MMSTRAFGAFVVVASLALPSLAVAQEQPPSSPPRGEGQIGPHGPGQRGPRGEGRMGPREVQQLFDAYALVQAEEALKLTDDQYGRFVSRMKALQDTRRRNQWARMQILRELNRLASADSAVDEAGIRDRLKALQEQDEKGAAELAKASAAVDEVLDVRQQALFRVFEETMERRKFELLMRARQGRPGSMDRQRNPQPQPQPQPPKEPQL